GGSGVKLANVYASLDGGSFWRVGQTTADSLAVPIDSSGTYSFYAMAVDEVGNVETSRPDAVTTNVTLVDIEEDALPYRFERYPNYPNPFNPETTIGYSLPQMDRVRLEVFDVTGRLVARLVDEVKAPGRYRTVWDARTMASGVYFCRLIQGSSVEVRPVVLVR
ncbi:MAG: T9SS type A sorting domain-containing protein, partial [Rhodothermales bacterium]|nr:T9SS type A sorting domain-containing protein [Rhodothermales bacterium]